MAKRSKEHYTEQENAEWNELYQYVHDKVFEYDDTIKLSRYMILRLKGLREGNYIANKNLPRNAKYPFSAILNTFKLCYKNIKYAMTYKKFKDEKSMIKYIMAIVESNLNDVYKRMRDIELAKEKQNNIDAGVAINTDLSAIYEKKKQEAKKQPPKSKNRYSDLW